MSDTGISPAIMQEIIEIAGKHEVRKLILFGSRARRDFRKTSDIDLAVLGGNIAGFALDLEESTSTLLEYDIVDLDKSVQPELLASIKKEGKIIYEKI